MSGPDYGRRIPSPIADQRIEMSDWLAAMDLARAHMPPEHGDAKRVQFDVDRIRQALALPSYANYAIEMSCFNKAEADDIARLLSQSERARVRFAWCR